MIFFHCLNIGLTAWWVSGEVDGWKLMPAAGLMMVCMQSCKVLRELDDVKKENNKCDATISSITSSLTRVSRRCRWKSRGFGFHAMCFSTSVLYIIIIYTQTRDGSSVITPRSNNNVVAEKMANEIFQYFVVPQGSLHVAFGGALQLLSLLQHTQSNQDHVWFVSLFQPIVFNFSICLLLAPSPHVDMGVFSGWAKNCLPLPHLTSVESQAGCDMIGV